MSNEHKNKWSNAEVIKLAEEYYTKFKTERKKLPFWVNLVDVIGANENAHTRILQILLSYKSENNYPIFDSFIRRFAPNRKKFKSIGRYLFKLNHPFKIHKGNDKGIRYPDIYTYPQDYKSGVSIIIENKINYAEDRIGQVEDYIKGMYDDRKDNNSKKTPNDNCYAFCVLSEMLNCKRGGKHDKMGRQMVKNDILGQYIADDHYVLLTYKEDILPWLKEEILLYTYYKEKYLILNVELYISYLENRFNMRENINKTQLNILHNMEDVNSLKLYELIELRKAIETLSKDQKTYLLNHFENLIRENLKTKHICNNKGNNEYYKGFYVNIKRNIPLSFYCELNVEEDKPCFSIGIAEDDREKEGDLKEELEQVQNESIEAISYFSKIVECKGIEDGYYPKFSFVDLTYENIKSILSDMLPKIIDKFKNKFL